MERCRKASPVSALLLALNVLKMANLGEFDFIFDTYHSGFYQPFFQAQKYMT